MALPFAVRLWKFIATAELRWFFFISLALHVTRAHWAILALRRQQVLKLRI
jgi:hypothetical protein